MKIKLVVIVAAMAICAIGAPAVSLSANCPIDGAAAMLESQDYANGHAICVYSHTTLQGYTHRFTTDCR
jgi:hypothetical protein